VFIVEITDFGPIRKLINPSNLLARMNNPLAWIFKFDTLDRYFPKHAHHSTSKV